MAITITGNIQFTGGFTWINPPVTYFTDPYYNLTALQLNGENPSVTWITDASPQVNAITTAGNVTPNRFSPIGPVGYYSNYFNGSSVLTTPSNSQFAWGTGDFTVELWFYNTVAFGSGGNVVAGTLAAGGGLLYGRDSFGMAWNIFSGSNIVQYTPQLALNSWYHIAYSRRSSTGYLFINGTLIGSAADTTNYTYATFAIGGTATQRITGYVSNLRVVTGQALYTAAFTPATQPLTAIGTQTSLLTAMGPSFTDYSPNGFTFTLTGTPSVQTNQPFGAVPNPATVPAYQNGYYSNYFNGSTGWLSITNNATLNPGTNSFTIEAWIYATGSVVSASIYEGRQNGLSLSFSSSSYLQGGQSFVAAKVVDTVAFPLNQWVHVAWVRNGTQDYLYKNGQLVAVASGDATSYVTSIGNYIGTNGNSGGYFPGYISNLRLVIGTALYTSLSFTPPSQPLTIVNTTQTVLLTALNSSISDASSYANTVTNNSLATTVAAVQSPFTLPTVSLPTASLGSGLFDGSTGYLSTPFNANFVLGSGSYTAEAWIYLTSGTGATYGQQVMGTYQGGSNIPGWAIIVNYTTGAKGISWVINNTSIASYTSYLLAGQWYHIAIVRNGTGTNNTTIYLNGISVAQVTDNTLDSNTSNPLNIGIQTNASGSYFPGYISNARFVKGTAIYTTNFAPSNQPLTAVAGTSLLTLQNRQGNNNNIFQDDSPNNFAITRVGTPTQGSFSPFSQNGWSVYFDGSSGYLAPQTGALTFNGNFTIECWVYDFGTVSYSTPWGARTGTSGFTGGTLQRNNGNNLQFAWNNGGGTITQTNGSYTPNTWHHVALTLSGTTLTLWVDGVNVGTGSLTPPFVLGTNTLNIGIDPYNRVSACYFPGYISNFRITNGAALYTTAFTPSTVALTTATGSTGTVTLLTAQANRLVDVSSSATTITPSGTVSVQPISPFTNMSSGTVPTGLYSYLFDGSTGYLSYSGIVIGTNAFTIEFWFYATNFNNTAAPFGTSNNNGLSVRISPSTTQFTIDSFGVSNTTFTVPALSTNTWYHVAAVRNSSNATTIFLNGVRSSTGAVTVNTNFSGASNWIGYFGSGSYFPGYISNMRVINGASAYDPTQSTITVPTQPLTAVANTVLLTAQNNSFTDVSTVSNALTVNGSVQLRQQSPFILTTQSLTSNQYSTTLVGGGMYFNGSTDYLSSSLVPLGAGNWTVDFWMYPLSSGNQYIFTIGSTPDWGDNNGVQMLYYLGYFAVGGISGGTNTVYPTITNQWIHVALVQTGTTVKLYLNGAASGTVMSNSSNLTGAKIQVGHGAASSWGPFNGYIANFRTVAGAALYTSNFAVPTTPPQPVAYVTSSTTATTGLLLLGTNGGIVDQSGRSNLVTVGTATISNSVFKTGTGSMYFGGSSSLTMPASPFYAFGGPFTVEMWVYPTANIPAFAKLFLGGSSGTPLCIDVQTTGLTLTVNNNSTVLLTSSIPLNLNAWNHVAVSRNSTTMYLFINGQVGASAADSTNFTSAGTVSIGTNGTAYFIGYIDDLRVTNGYARYQTTATFTPLSIGLPVQ